MLSPEKLTCLELVRDYSRLTSFPDKKGAPLILVTDYEGPIELGDPVDMLMKRINPRLYLASYQCFTIDRLSGRYDPRLAQEAHDTIFTLPIFAAKDFTELDLLEAAKISQITPGAKETLYFLKDQSALVVAVTSAPELMYRDRAKELGVDGVIGTSFPLDGVVKNLQQSGRYHQEMEIVNAFLNDFAKIESSVGMTGRPLAESLHNRFRVYLENELGVIFQHDQRGKRGDNYKTIFGQVLEAGSTIGDYSKEEIAALVQQNNASSNTVTVTIGDGENDRRMLAANPRSLAINGPTAVLDARFGAFTPDVSWVQIPYFEFILKNPDASPNDVVKHVDGYLKRNYPQAYETEGVRFHLGGLELQGTSYQVKHAEIKRQLRGNIIY